MHVLSPVDKDGAVQMAIIASIRSYLLHFGSAADAGILLVESVFSPRLYFPAVPLIHYARRPFHLATLRSAGGRARRYGRRLRCSEATKTMCSGSFAALRACSPSALANCERARVEKRMRISRAPKSN